MAPTILSRPMPCWVKPPLLYQFKGKSLQYWPEKQNITEIVLNYPDWWILEKCNIVTFFEADNALK